MGFDADLIIPFAVAAVAASLRAMGDVTICRKTNDAGWTRPDMRTISGGALANGLSTALAGLLDTIGTNTSTSNVGLAAATGVTSRKVAYATDGIYLLLAFMIQGRSTRCRSSSSWKLMALRGALAGTSSTALVSI